MSDSRLRGGRGWREAKQRANSLVDQQEGLCHPSNLFKMANYFSPKKWLDFRYGVRAIEVGLLVRQVGRSHCIGTKNWPRMSAEGCLKSCNWVRSDLEGWVKRLVERKEACKCQTGKMLFYCNEPKWS